MLKAAFPRAAVNLSHWNPHRANTTFDKMQPFWDDFCPLHQVFLFADVVLESVVKVTQNCVSNAGVLSVFSLFIATRWHCRLKGKQPLLFRDTGGRWETWGKKNHHTARLKFLLGLGEMQGRVLLSAPRPAVLMAASGMFAVLLSWGVSPDSASANGSCSELFLPCLGSWCSFRAVRRMMVAPRSLFCFSLHV